MTTDELSECHKQYKNRFAMRTWGLTLNVIDFFLVKKIPLSRRVGYVMGGSVSGSVRDISMLQQSDWIYY